MNRMGSQVGSKPCTLVIGIGPGLGRALVRTFASEGHAVAFVGRREAEVRRHEQELRAEGFDVTGIIGDAGSPESMENVFSQVAEIYGSPEVLIYNAALIEPSRFVTHSGKSEVKYGTADGWNALGEPVSLDYLKHAFSVNVTGALDAAQKVVPGMLERGRGTILLTGGVLAFEPWIEWGVTSLSKAALRSLGRSLDKELRDSGIHVCTVAIHGTMQAGTPYDHDLVADAYWKLHRQPAAEWEAEYHFRADAGDGGDPDA